MVLLHSCLFVYLLNDPRILMDFDRFLLKHSGDNNDIKELYSTFKKTNEGKKYGK